ncbi:MAG: serine hydrolase domain-containing protein [Sphingobium sp.]
MRAACAALMLFAALAPPSAGALARSVEAGAAATPQALERLDAHVKGVVAAGQFSGVVLVARDGAVLFERAYGLRDEKRADPVTPETRFDLASAGKMFTATAVLQQIAAGRLSLTTTLGEVLHDYPNAAMRTATIAQLLTHSAGAGIATPCSIPAISSGAGARPAWPISSRSMANAIRPFRPARSRNTAITR